MFTCILSITEIFQDFLLIKSKLFSDLTKARYVYRPTCVCFVNGKLLFCHLWPTDDTVSELKM